MPMYRTLNQDFFKTWSPEMAYVLGYFAADGSMVENKRGAHFVEFTSTDYVLIKNLKKTIGSNHTVTARERGGNCKTAYRLQVGSNAWFQALMCLGFTPRKSATLHFPHVTAAYVGHFIRGYFDGDGCVYFNKLKYATRSYKRWVLMTLFTSGSRTFLESLHETLKAYGVRGGSVRNKTRGFELVFSHRDSLALYRLMYHTGPVSDLFLPRKRKKLERAISVLGLGGTVRS